MLNKAFTQPRLICAVDLTYTVLYIKTLQKQNTEICNRQRSHQTQQFLISLAAQLLACINVHITLASVSVPLSCLSWRMRKQSLIYKKNRRSIQERIEKIDSRKGYPFVEVQRDMQYKLQRHQSSWTLLLLATVVIVAIACFLANSSDFAQTILRLSGRTTPVNSVHITGDIEYDLALPKILLEKGIYNSSDFVNEAGVIPAYWESKENSTDHKRRYGPCYAYHRSSDVDWESEIELYNETGTPAYNDKIIHTDNPHDVHGYCRPGFIIIGAGKCGTSSLYHYVTSHPRALEASQKQIHYFKYVRVLGQSWYLMEAT